MAKGVHALEHAPEGGVVRVDVNKDGHQDGHGPAQAMTGDVDGLERLARSGARLAATWRMDRVPVDGSLESPTDLVAGRSDVAVETPVNKHRLVLVGLGEGRARWDLYERRLDREIRQPVHDVGGFAQPRDSSRLARVILAPLGPG